MRSCNKQEASLSIQHPVKKRFACFSSKRISVPEPAMIWYDSNKNQTWSFQRRRRSRNERLRIIKNHKRWYSTLVFPRSLFSPSTCNTYDWNEWTLWAAHLHVRDTVSKILSTTFDVLRKISGDEILPSFSHAPHQIHMNIRCQKGRSMIEDWGIWWYVIENGHLIRSVWYSTYCIYD